MKKYQKINQPATIGTHQNERLVVGIVRIEGAKTSPKRLLEVRLRFLAAAALHDRVVSVLSVVNVAEH